MSTIIHRFTPPTCTLEIKGRKPLSRWTDRKLTKFQFQLSFDDPRIPTAKQVKIKGDRQDLEQLRNAVDLYVQRFLQASFQPANRFLAKLKINNKLPNKQPYLQSQGLVNHELFFASLSHDNNDNKIELSTIQLFDLVTALEAYQTQIAALSEKQTRSKVIPRWGGIAAATIAVVGIAAIVIETRSPSLNGVQSPQVASSPQPEPSAEVEPDKLDEVIPPQAPKTVRTITKPKLSQPLDSAVKLPPPPAVDTPKPKPDIPDPADYPLSEVARQSGLNTTKQTPTEGQAESTIAVTPPTKETAIAKKNVNTDLTKPNNITPQSDAIDSDVEEELLNNSVDTPEDLAQSSRDDNVALRSSSIQTRQLQKVTTYFQQKWQPPAELKQSLEYRLFLDGDGSIKRVIPLGKASELYLNKTNIPVDGKPFISPSQAQPIIRLLLDPSGRVQAFIE